MLSDDWIERVIHDYGTTPLSSRALFLLLEASWRVKFTAKIADAPDIFHVHGRVPREILSSARRTRRQTQAHLTADWAIRSLRRTKRANGSLPKELVTANLIVHPGCLPDWCSILVNSGSISAGFPRRHVCQLALFQNLEFDFNSSPIFGLFSFPPHRIYIFSFD